MIVILKKMSRRKPANGDPLEFISIAAAVSRRATFLFLVLAANCCCHAQDLSPQSSKPIVNLVLTPKTDAEGRATAIELDYVLSEWGAGDGKPLVLQFDTLEPMLQRVTDQLHDLKASDDQGQLSFAPLGRRKEEDGEFQIWQSSRPAYGPVHVSYLVPVALKETPKRGPHVDIQEAGNGLSGAFMSFLCLPPIDGPMHVQVHWRLAAGQIAVSSYGLGDFHQDLDRDTLGTTLFLAGSLLTFPSPPPAQGFGMYSLGLLPDALKIVSPWTTRAYDVEREAFHGSPATPFRFMVRSYDGGPITSGRAAHESFLLYLPKGRDPGGQDLHDLVAHEMVHALIEDLDAAPGDDGDWYTEGTADYFKLILPYSGGLYTPREYLDLINREAATYYSNALATVPNHDLSKVMWSGRNAWTVPYARGALYFADLEGKLRNRGSKLHVLDLVNETSRRIRSGSPATEQTWIAVLKENVGAWAFADWKNMMDGRLLMPAPNAFGDCFVAVSTQVGIFDLGFRAPVRLQAGSTIAGLVPGSPAARAGLQNGDTITADIDINPIAASFHTPISIPILRDGKRRMVSYDPHMGSRQGMQWIPRSGNPDRPCPSNP